jgi:hypothetical protein
MSRRVLAALMIAMGAAAPAAAQSALKLREQGVQAYKALELDNAARLLRSALGSGDLPDTMVLSTEAYLGATEFYRHQSDSARAAFRRLVLREPRYRLDSLAFSPEVTAAFDSVRLATPALSVDVPPRATLEPGRGGMTARVYPSGPHAVRIRIETSSGEAVRTLREGRVTGSFTVTWDGAGPTGTLPSGLYVWSFASLDRRGDVQRIVDVPVRLEHTTVNAPAVPPKPTLLPEREPARRGLIPLGVGLGAAALALVATPVFTDEDAPRITLAVVFSAGGIIGFLEQRPGKRIPDNVAANQAALAAWQAEVQRAREEERRRNPGPRIILETSRPSVRR